MSTNNFCKEEEGDHLKKNIQSNRKWRLNIPVRKYSNFSIEFFICRLATFHLANNGDPKKSNIVYVEPYSDDDYDRQSIPERLDSAMQRTAEYVSGLNPDTDPYPGDNYHHHNHQQHGLPPLTIRRHVPGSNDPALQKMPTNLQPSENISSSSNVHVTIKRNSVSAGETGFSTGLFNRLSNRLSIRLCNLLCNLLFNLFFIPFLFISILLLLRRRLLLNILSSK